jgi:hypothetical protein
MILVFFIIDGLPHLKFYIQRNALRKLGFYSGHTERDSVAVVGVETPP